MNTPEQQNCKLGEAKIAANSRTTNGVWQVTGDTGRKVGAIYAKMSVVPRQLEELKLGIASRKKSAKEYENFDEIMAALQQAGLNLEETADDKIWDTLYDAIPSEKAAPKRATED